MLLIKTKTHICLASASRPSLANLNKSNVSVLEAHHVSGRSVDSMLGGEKKHFFFYHFWEYSLSSLTLVSAVLLQ